MLLAIICSALPDPCRATNVSAVASAIAGEKNANSEAFPKQILRAGVNLRSKSISDNSRQLAEELKLMPLLLRIQTLRKQVDPDVVEMTIESVALHQQLTSSTVSAIQIIEETNLAIEFALAEINAEHTLYSSILSTFSNARDKAVLKTNALSFIANGALWAIGEGFDIPTNRVPNLSVPSGILGVAAGVIPSIASMYALKQLDGRKAISESEPNMLAKLFNYRTDSDIEYPVPVWKFLNTVPASTSESKTRLEMLVDRWISDKNISGFTDRTSAEQLDVITASVPHKKGMSISTLNARMSMLQQLGAEILKMKRLLYELSMVVTGEKNV
jgi:hypothetical protein